jgi:opacity protein-like surface antigen
MRFKIAVVSLMAGVLPLAFAGVAAADVVEAEEVVVGEEVVPPPPPPPVAVEPDYNRLGPYIGLGASYFINEFGDPLDRAHLSDSWGFNARFGYRFIDWLAVEGLYEYANNFGCDLGHLEGSNDMSVQANIFTVDAKAILPLGRFQPYLSGGVGFLNANASRTGIFREFEASSTVFAGRVGGGIDLYLTEQFALMTEAGYLLPTGDLDDMNMIPINAGFRYIF